MQLQWQLQWFLKKGQLMKIFDTHSHYNDEKFEEDREAILKKVETVGVDRIVIAGYDIPSSEKAIAIANEQEGYYAICGVSPNDVPETVQEIEKQLKRVKELADSHKIVAIGEIGLDYHWNTENKEIQKVMFQKQMEIANQKKLPIVIHTREAIEDTLQMLKEYPVQEKGIFHCCPLNRELVKEALKLGFFISFAGPITFKNAKNADEIITMVPLDKMVVETDCPYMAPEPVRGSRNDSSNLIYHIRKIAAVKGMSEEEIANITYQNAKKIFKIK